MKARVALLALLCAACAEHIEAEPMVRMLIQPDTFERRARELDRKNSPTRAVPVMPLDIPRHGSWTSNPQIGREAPFDPDAQNRQTILRLDEWGPPEEWTISLGITNGFTAFNGFSVRALIEFGAGGSTQTYVCDWANGTQVTLPMNALNVIAEYENVDVTNEGRGLRLGVQIARGPRPASAPSPVLTLMEDTEVGAGDATAFDLPLFARRAFLNSTIDPANPAFGPFYADTTKLGFQAGDAVGATFTQLLPFGNAVVASQGLPVTGSSRRVLVINSGANPIRGTLWVELEG